MNTSLFQCILYESPEAQKYPGRFSLHFKQTYCCEGLCYFTTLVVVRVPSVKVVTWMVTPLG